MRDLVKHFVTIDRVLYGDADAGYDIFCDEMPHDEWWVDSFESAMSVDDKNPCVLFATFCLKGMYEDDDEEHWVHISGALAARLLRQLTSAMNRSGGSE
jgi:hypothetical protein